MSQNEIMISKNEIGGSISYSENVIATISGLAAGEIKGVVGTSGGIKSGIVELFGKKDLSKGIKATITEDEVQIDVNLVLVYGVTLQEVAAEVQANIKRAVEGMTGLIVSSVNINILSVQVVPEAKAGK